MPVCLRFFLPQLMPSPVYAGSRQVASPLQLSNPTISPELSSMDVSADDLDVSIADLVKTRRRTGSSRPFPTSSTPTRTKCKPFLPQH